MTEPPIVGRPGDIEIGRAEFAKNPYRTYEQLRESCPVARSEEFGGFWLITRHDDVRAAARDWRTFSSGGVGVTAIPVVTPRDEPQLPIELDPPEHTQYRRLVAPLFSRNRVAMLRSALEALVQSLWQNIGMASTSDLVEDYCVPLSVGALARLTGLPEHDTSLWTGWIRAMFDSADPETGQEAALELGAYIDGLIGERRRSPTDDFIGVLLDAEIGGRKLTDTELRSFCTLMFGAGFETTADALSVTLHQLLANPELHRDLIEHPAHIGPAVEEFLRFASPIQIFGRNATTDVTMHNTTIRAGDVVGLSFGSANHDPDVYADPEECRFDRSPKHHLAFGFGPHLCLGAPLARLELEVTLRTFVSNWSPGDLVPKGKARWKGRGDRRGLETITVMNRLA